MRGHRSPQENMFVAWITYRGVRYACGSDESVLVALERANLSIPSSCRSGICQACLMQARMGEIPVPAQDGLTQTLKTAGCFLACTCIPVSDMTVSLPTRDTTQTKAKLIGKVFLPGDLVRLHFQSESPFTYRPGQYATFCGPGDLSRAYTLVSLPSADGSLVTYVRRKAYGRMSQWLCDTLEPGDTLYIRGPAGTCYYRSASKEAPLVLIGTGIGLAPLLGIAIDALTHRHRGRITILHGVTESNEVYFSQELRDLSKLAPTIRYQPCSSQTLAGCLFRDSAETMIPLPFPPLTGAEVHICGEPELTEAFARRAQDAGADPASIHCTAFIDAPLRSDQSQEKNGNVHLLHAHHRYLQ